MTRSRPGGAPPASRAATGVDLWLAAIRPGDEGLCADAVPEEERAACAQFHFEADRRRALVTRALVRRTLSRYAAVGPGEWRFAAGAHGRPEIASPAGTRLRFNLSHTRELVACAVTFDHDVGADVERIAPHDDLEALARTVFTQVECEALGALPVERRAERFCALWTLKEAYLKARGLGFSLSPLRLAFDLESHGRAALALSREAQDDARAWWFGLLDAGHGHLGAIALRGPAPPGHVTVFCVTAAADDVPGSAAEFLAVSAPLA